MNENQAILKAIRVHSDWKRQLRCAVAERKPHLSAAQACRDDLCEFGRWLHQLPEANQAQPRWQRTHDRHTEFHREAGAVLAALEGAQPQSADALLGPEGGFTAASFRLLNELTAWSRDAGPGAAPPAQGAS